MNSLLEDLRRADSRIFDRLADGELCPADQCTLLAALDDEPGAWRRAALAFIEAQALRCELADWQLVTPQRVLPADIPRHNMGGVRHAALRRPTAGHLTLVAAVCLAFLAGLVCARLRPFGDSRDAGGQLAQRDPLQANRAAKTPAPLTPDEPPPATNRDTAASTAVSDGTLRLTFTGATPDDDQKIELPLVFATHIDQEWFDAQQESAVPAEVLDAWRKAGHVVTRRQQLWPIHLDDGRQMLLPVEEVEIDYASDRSVF